MIKEGFCDKVLTLTSLFSLIIKEGNLYRHAVTRCYYIHESREAGKCMLLQLTILLLPSLTCSNSHIVGIIGHKMQVLIMDCTVQYLRYVLTT